jgi:hypothetical protein
VEKWRDQKARVTELEHGHMGFETPWLPCGLLLPPLLPVHPLPAGGSNAFKGEKILIKLFCTTNWTMIFKSLHQPVSKLIMPDGYFIPFPASQLLMIKGIKHWEVVTMPSDYCG